MRLILLVILPVAVVLGIKFAAARSRSPANRFQAGFLLFAGLWVGAFAATLPYLSTAILTAVAAGLFLLSGIAFWLERIWARWLAIAGVGCAVASNVRMMTIEGWAIPNLVVIGFSLWYAWGLLRERTIVFEPFPPDLVLPGAPQQQSMAVPAEREHV